MPLKTPFAKLPKDEREIRLFVKKLRDELRKAKGSGFDIRVTTCAIKTCDCGGNIFLDVSTPNEESSFWIWNRTMAKKKSMTKAERSMNFLIIRQVYNQLVDETLFKGVEDGNMVNLNIDVGGLDGAYLNWSDYLQYN
jgi:hypothetical protein